MPWRQRRAHRHVKCLPCGSCPLVLSHVQAAPTFKQCSHYSGAAAQEREAEAQVLAAAVAQERAERTARRKRLASPGKTLEPPPRPPQPSGMESGVARGVTSGLASGMASPEVSSK